MRKLTIKKQRLLTCERNYEEKVRKPKSKPNTLIPLFFSHMCCAFFDGAKEFYRTRAYHVLSVPHKAMLLHVHSGHSVVYSKTELASKSSSGSSNNTITSTSTDTSTSSSTGRSTSISSSTSTK